MDIWTGSSEFHHQKQITATRTMAGLGGEGYNGCSFEEYLLDGEVEFNLGDPMYHQGYENSVHQCSALALGNNMDRGEGLPTSPQPAHHAMAKPILPETALSEEKSQAIFTWVKEQYREPITTPLAKEIEDLLEHDRGEDSHRMSRKMMQTYIESYWDQFNNQFPILHKPTFSPERTPNILLIAMMAIGASFLDKIHGHEGTQAGVEVSNVLAWHLRGEIFSDFNFRPPTKLWVLQSLLLLELYEKMCSTRLLHELAHVHHATTITVIRRGCALIGGSAPDSPGSGVYDEQGFDKFRHASTPRLNTPDESWTCWIIKEATRRAAFAAFVIDSVHSTMFGQATVMSAHEMRLPLPCGEGLWSATSSCEFGRIEAMLHANEVKPITFLDGLKRTLNAEEIHTTSFGRTILMAGLLNVSWHLNQRDLLVNSLGVSHALNERFIWRGSLTRAFDSWKQQFGRCLPSFGGVSSEQKIDDFQSMTVLHHLAHMATHVDIVDCQIFARAEQVGGRIIEIWNLNSVHRRMKEQWAPTAKARDATWYAIRFLSMVLISKKTKTGTMHTACDDSSFDYSARHDVLLNRPWIIYFAALIVWCYGFALEGPTNGPIPAACDFKAQVKDMRAYLQRLDCARSPEELKAMGGLNGCSGMLMVLRTVFKESRWELLHEAAALLDNCIGLLEVKL